MRNLKKGLLVILLCILVIQDASFVLASSLAKTGQINSFFSIESERRTENRKPAIKKDKMATDTNAEAEIKEDVSKTENTEKTKTEKLKEQKKATNSDAEQDNRPSDQEENQEKENQEEELSYSEEIIFPAAKEAAEDINFAFNEERIIGCVGDKMYCRDLLAESELEGEFSCTSSNTDIVDVLNSGIKYVYLYLNKEGKAEIEATLTLENGEKRITNLTVEVVKRQIKFTTNENPIRIPLGKTIEVPVDKRYLGYYLYGAWLYYTIGDAQVVSVFKDIDGEKIRGLKIGTTAITFTHKDLTETREVEVYTDIRLGDVKVERDFPGVTELSWTMENTPYYRIERAGEGEGYYSIFEGEDGGLRNQFIDRDLKPGAKYRYRISAMAADEEGQNRIVADTKEIVVNVNKKEIKFKNPGWCYAYVNETYPVEVEYIGYDKDADLKVQWSSSNPEIARIDKDGKVTALKDGITQISIRLEDGNEVVNNLYVYPVQEVEDLNIAVNFNEYVKLVWSDQSAQKAYVIYRRENNKNWEKLEEKKDCGFIDKTALSGHTYQYKVTALRQHNNTYETSGTIIDVTVSDHSVKLLSDVVQARKGKTYDLPLEITGFDEPPVITCSSSNEQVATVNAENRKVTVIDEGRAEITIAFPEGAVFVCTYFCVERPKNMCTETEWKVFTITNQNRMKEGHDPLSMFPQMQKATDIRKKELVQLYSHDRPNGSECFSVFKEVNLDYPIAGENIAYGYGSPEAVMNGWMNSPGHYRNIMGDFQHFAAGETKDKWVQMFIGCFDKMDLMAMAPANGNRTFKKGTKVEDFGEIVVLNCKEHGNVYMPLLSKMCTGYDEDTVGEQTITVHYKDKTTTFTVTIKDSGNSGTNNSNTGNSGSSGGGGGGGSRGSSGGRSLAGGPGAAGISSAPVLVGFWIKDAVGWWFQPLDKAYPQNQWAQINGAIYHFGENGYMTEGWFAEAGKWYYLMPGNGAVATGWIKQADTWYYLNIDGSMAVGWIQDAGKWYYLGIDGGMLANTITPDNYVVGADGAWIP